MKFPKGLKVEACASREVGRYAMHGIKVEGDRAVATNGFVIAVVPVESEDGDDAHGQIVPAEAIKLARKVAGAKADAVVTVNGTVRAAGQELQAIDGEFPRYQACIPSVTAESHVMVTLDARLLSMLFDAIAGDDGAVTFCVSRKAGEPVVLVPNACNDSGGIGVVMPISYDSDGLRVSERVAWAQR